MAGSRLKDPIPAEFLEVLVSRKWSEHHWNLELFLCGARLLAQDKGFIKGFWWDSFKHCINCDWSGNWATFERLGSQSFQLWNSYRLGEVHRHQASFRLVVRWYLYLQLQKQWLYFHLHTHIQTWKLTLHTNAMDYRETEIGDFDLL